MRWYLRTIVAAALAVAAEPALAHTGQGVSGGFATGFMHPIGGVDHLLAMIAVGVWAAFLGRPLIWVLPVAFPLMMVAGAVVGIAQVPVPSVEPAIAASVLVLGAVTAAAWRAPMVIAIILVAAFAFFHGYAHGLELPAANDAASYVAGFVAATVSIHLAGIAFGHLMQAPGGLLAFRVSGAAIALAGAWITAGVLGVA